MGSRQSGSINKLGQTIETAEIADNQVTLAKIADLSDLGSLIYGSTAGAPADLAAGTAGQVLETNGTASAPAWVNKDVEVLGAGIVTLATGSTSFGTDNADIAITAGQLSADDLIRIKMLIDNADGSRTISWDIQAQDTTVTGSIVTDADRTSPGETNPVNAELSQHPATNDVLHCAGHMIDEAGASTLVGFLGQLDTNDANVFSTAWTLRLTFKYNLSAASASKIRYWVELVRGG